MVTSSLSRSNVQTGFPPGFWKPVSYFRQKKQAVCSHALPTQRKVLISFILNHGHVYGNKTSHVKSFSIQVILAWAPSGFRREDTISGSPHLTKNQQLEHHLNLLLCSDSPRSPPVAAGQIPNRTRVPQGMNSNESKTCWKKREPIIPEQNIIFLHVSHPTVEIISQSRSCGCDWRWGDYFDGRNTIGDHDGPWSTKGFQKCPQAAVSDELSEKVV